MFHRKADRWSIEYDGKLLCVPHCQGLQIVAHLVENPRRRFGASDLLRLIESDRLRSRKKPDPDGRGAPRTDYRRLLLGLRARLRRAARENDPRAARDAQREMEVVTRDLARAIGLSSADISDAAQVVERTISGAIAAIERSNRELARYLSRTISTGSAFTYIPE